MKLVDDAGETGGLDLVKNADQAFLIGLDVGDDLVAEDHRQHFGRMRHVRTLVAVTPASRARPSGVEE